MKSVVFTKSFFEKLKEKASNSSQFTIGYKYNTQSKELLSFFLETEDLVLSVYENNLNNSINSIKIVKENGKFKEIQQKKVEDAKFNHNSLFVVKEAIRELKSEYQCIEKQTFPYSSNIFIECYTFSSKKIISYQGQ